MTYLVPPIYCLCYYWSKRDAQPCTTHLKAGYGMFYKPKAEEQS